MSLEFNEDKLYECGEYGTTTEDVEHIECAKCSKSFYLCNTNDCYSHRPIDEYLWCRACNDKSEKLECETCKECGMNINGRSIKWAHCKNCERNGIALCLDRKWYRKFVKSSWYYWCNFCSDSDKQEQ